jgi:predicted transcriptional regulator
VPGDVFLLTSEQIRAARALLRWEQKDLASASGVSLPSIKRLEAKPGPMNAHGPTLAALSRAIEEAGVQFIPGNGGGPGVRLRYPIGAGSTEP